MLDQIIAKLPCSFIALTPDEQGYLSGIANPHGGFSDEARELFSGYRLQCDKTALEAIALFNTTSNGLIIAPDAQNRISVELLTDCGERGNYRALRDVLMQLQIVAVDAQ